MVTQTILSNMWWAYAEMLRTAHDLLPASCSWAGACECHGWLSEVPADHEQVNPEKVYSLEADNLMACRRQWGLEVNRNNQVRDRAHFGPCPLVGKRPVELARGDALRFFEDFGARGHMHIMS